MNRTLLCILFVIMSFAAAACDNAGFGEPVVIDRAMLADALRGAAVGPPGDVSCVAESKLSFEGRRAPFIVETAHADDAADIEPIIAVSDLHILLYEHAWDTKGRGCPDGNLYYIVPATEDRPVTIESRIPACGLEQCAAAGEAFRADQNLRGHFEISSDDAGNHGIKLVIDRCQSADDA